MKPKVPWATGWCEDLAQWRERAAAYVPKGLPKWIVCAVCGKGPAEGAQLRLLRPFNLFVCEWHDREQRRKAFASLPGFNAVTIVKPTVATLEAIAGDLREVDRKELAVTRNPDDARALARDSFESYYCRAAFVGFEPEFAFGASALPGAVQVWAYGTSRADRALLTVTKYILRCMVPDLLGSGVRSAQAVSHPENAQAHRWLKFLGFTLKATLSGVGSRREDMFLFVTSAADVHRRSPVAA